MDLNSPNSRSAIVNLLADFILSKINTEELSIIKIVDCINFIVIKGRTTSDKILNVQEIVDEFKKIYTSILESKKLLSHTIDLIEYDFEMDEVENITHTFFSSENCLYNQNQILNFEKDKTKSFRDNYIASPKDDEMIVVSNFPFGYSFRMGRALYYLGKHIIYNLPTNYPFTEITLTVDKDPEKLKVFDNFFRINDETLKSATLDCINMDLTWVIEEIKKVDWFSESSNPLQEFDFIKKKNRDFIII